MMGGEGNGGDGRGNEGKWKRGDGREGGEATFIGLGCDTRGGHHNPTFDIDEDLLQWGVDILYGIVKQKNEK